MSLLGENPFKVRAYENAAGIVEGYTEDELKEKIAVYFIDEPRHGMCNPPRPVGLTFDEQPKWPAGFFQEAWELESQIEAVRQAKKTAPK